MFWEILHLAVRVVVIGGLLGFVLYKIFFAAYLHMLEVDMNIFEQGIFQNPYPSLIAGGAFLLIYLLLFVIQTIKIRKLTAMELLRESKAGDKKSKFKALTAILGLLCLGGGYYISITTTNPMGALQKLFIAVILVIIGTYLAFSVIISAILNILKRNKKFYYKKENFAAISGLMFRVKNSSRSLAGITILSTSVMVILTSGLSLYLGTNENIKNMIPSDYVISENLIDKEDKMVLENHVKDYLEENNLKAETDSYLLYSTLTYRDGGDLLPMPKNIEFRNFSNYESYVNLDLIFTDRHQNLFDKSNVLEVKSKEKDEDLKLRNFDKQTDRKNIDDIDFKFPRNIDIIDSRYFITNDYDQFNELKKLMAPEKEDSYYFYEEVLLLNKKEESEKWDSFQKDIKDYLSSKGLDDMVVTSREDKIKNEIELNSSIFFMGILLGIAFLVSTAIFIYYKQLSEGFDDVDRFRIMRQVGMTDDEAKATVRKQIGVVFMLPVLFTIMHTAFAIPILSQFLKVVGLANLKIMLISMAISAGFFIIFNFVTFILTEKVYMNLILEKNK